MNTTRLILLNRMKDLSELTSEQLKNIELSMIDYSIRRVSEYRNREIKEVLKEGVKLIPRLYCDNIILHIRKWSFKIACHNAQQRADTENYLVYVIRSSQIGYTLLSTLDVKHNRRIRVFGKNTNAIKLYETADFIATPKKRK